MCVYEVAFPVYVCVYEVAFPVYVCVYEVVFLLPLDTQGVLGPHYPTCVDDGVL